LQRRADATHHWDEVPVFIIKNNLRTAGISREEYFALLDRV